MAISRKLRASVRQIVLHDVTIIDGSGALNVTIQIEYGGNAAT